MKRVLTNSRMKLRLCFNSASFAFSSSSFFSILIFSKFRSEENSVMAACSFILFIESAVLFDTVWFVCNNFLGKLLNSFAC